MRRQQQWLFEAPYPSQIAQSERSIPEPIHQRKWLFEVPPESISGGADYMARQTPQGKKAKDRGKEETRQRREEDNDKKREDKWLRTASKPPSSNDKNDRNQIGLTPVQKAEDQLKGIRAAQAQAQDIGASNINSIKKSEDDLRRELKILTNP